MAIFQHDIPPDPRFGYQRLIAFSGDADGASPLFSYWNTNGHHLVTIHNNTDISVGDFLEAYQALREGIDAAVRQHGVPSSGVKGTLVIQNEEGFSDRHLSELVAPLTPEALVHTFGCAAAEIFFVRIDEPAVSLSYEGENICISSPYPLADVFAYLAKKPSGVQEDCLALGDMLDEVIAANPVRNPKPYPVDLSACTGSVHL